ncbi:MAG: hypothetical protein WD929_03105 [Steroidobacteraceae bacterium]
METSTPTPQADNGHATRPRRASAHAPGQPYGEAVKELLGLAAVAQILADFGASEEPRVAAELAVHLAHRLDAISTLLMGLDLRAAPAGDA